MADKERKSREDYGFKQTYGNNEVRVRKGCGNPSCYCTGDCDKPSSKLSLKIDVDVSEALTGLKAMTRASREATKALRELESAKLEASAVKSIADDIRRCYE